MSSEAQTITALELTELSRFHEVSREWTDGEQCRILYATERESFFGELPMVEVRYEDPTIGKHGKQWLRSNDYLGVVVHD